MKLKSFFINEKMCEIYAHASKWQVCKFYVRKFFINVTRVLVILGAFSWTYIAGSHFNPEIVYAAKEVIVDSGAPILEKIAKCESPTGHFDKNGQVRINKTQDAGKFQINLPIWGKKATEMGLNLMVEKDNEAFAIWLYKNKGTEPWIHSKNCWAK